MGPLPATTALVALIACRFASAAWAQDVPGRPGQPDVVVTGRTAAIRWAPPATGGVPSFYLIAAGTEPGGSDLGVHQVGPTTSVGPIPLNDGAYFIRVIAANAAGFGPPSVDRFFMIGGAVPGAPGTPVATIAGTRVTLQWTASVAAGVPTHYVVVVGTRLGASDLGAYDVGLTTSVTATLVPGTYCVRIIAANAFGSGIPSTDMSFTVGGAPGIPGLMSARQDGAAVTLEWGTPSSGGPPVRYLVAAGSAPGTANLGVFDAGANNSLTATAPPGTYFTRVVAVNAAGQSPPSFELALTLGEIPTLLSPPPEAVVRQNDSSTSCFPHATRGFGSRIAFDWSDVVSSSGVAGYHIILQGANASIPAIDQHVVTSDFEFMNCNGFVIPANRFDWEWRVRTFDLQGRYGAWSPPRRLHFGPCQLGDGTPCYAAVP